MNENELAYYAVRGVISSLSPEEKAKVDILTAQLNGLKKANDLTLFALAVAVVGYEMGEEVSKIEQSLQKKECDA